MRYVLIWGNDWSFDTVPAHESGGIADTVYCSKDAALNAAINQLCQQRSALDHAIKVARKKQARRDRRALGRKPA